MTAWDLRKLIYFRASYITIFFQRNQQSLIYSTGNFREKSKDLLSWFVVIMVSQEIPIRKMCVSIASLFEFLAREIIQSFIWLLIDCKFYL